MLLASLNVAVYGEALSADNQLILSVSVNGVDKGDMLVIAKSDNDGLVWFTEEDFLKLGIALTGLIKAELDGINYLKLEDSSVLTLKIDWDNLKLNLEADPVLLAIQQFSFASNAWYEPAEAPTSSAFANYSLAALDSDHTSGNYDANLDLNVSVGNWVFRSANSWNNSTGYQRQSTQVFRDWPDRQLRLTAGDTFAYAGESGRGGSIAGFRLEKLYELEAGYQRAPLAGLSGTVSTESVADIYTDNTKIRTVSLDPGRFEFNDIFYYAGLRQIDVKITDAAGNTQVITAPYYFSESSLKQGLHEFSYAAGMRRIYAGEGDGYDGFLVTALHRYGLSDSITAGVQAEYADDYQSAGTQWQFRLGQFGVAGLNLAASHTPGQASGQSLRLTHGYTGNRFSFSSSYVWQSQGFAAPVTDSTVSLFRNHPQHQVNAGISLGIAGNHTISLDGSWTRFYTRDFGHYLGMRYNWNISHSINLGMTLAHRREDRRDGMEGALTLSVNFGDDWNATSHTERGFTGYRDSSVTLNRSTSVGPGTGVRLDFDKDSDSQSGEAWLQHNTGTGTYTVSGKRSSTLPGLVNTVKSARVSGALAWSQGGIYATRAIGNSFAVVSAGGLEHVGVYHNNQ